MKNIREIVIRQVANGFTVDVRGEKDGNPFHSETRIAADLTRVKEMLDEMLA